MRHNRTINHLGRKSGHRKSMLANMACSLILHKRIETTVAKAKALREYVVAPKIADRPGGYTRIIKTGFRQGDAADMAFIELVDFNDAALGTKDASNKKTSTRRSRKKTAAPKEAENTEAKSE